LPRTYKTAVWLNVDISCVLSAGTYAIVFKGLEGSSSAILAVIVALSDVYDGGRMMLSNDGGNYWQPYGNYDIDFRIYGYDLNE